MIDLAHSPLRNAGWVHDQTLGRSAAPSSAGFTWCHDAGFDGFVDLREAHERRVQPGEWPGLDTLWLPTKDHHPVAEDDLAHFRNWLPTRKRVLVFCGAGSGRTGYLVARLRYDLDMWLSKRIREEAQQYRTAFGIHVPHFLQGLIGGWLDPLQREAFDEHIKSVPPGTWKVLT